MSGTLRLRGSTSGYSELQAPAVAADQTFILPTAGGTLLTTDSPISKLTLELGSASQPSLTFEGDTDTGLYSSGTNTLNLVTGGNNRLNIDSAGNVGIGSGNLFIGGTDAATADIALNADGTATFVGRVRVGDYDNNNGANINVKGAITLKKTDSTDAQIVGQLSGTETFKVLSNGSAEFKDGSSIFAGVNGGSAVFYGGDSNTTSQSNSKFRINSNGSATFADTVDSSKFFRSTRTASSGGELFFQGKVGSDTNCSIAANGSATFAGKVEAGDGTNSAGGIIARENNSNSTTAAVIARNYAASGKVFSGRSSTGGETSFIKEDGDATFGTGQFTQPASDQSGGAALKATGTAYGTNKAIHAYINSSNSARSLIFAENANGTVLNVQADGNVGIGNSNPAAKLVIGSSSGLEARVLHNSNGTTVLRRDGAISYLLSESGNPANRELVLGGQSSAGGTILEHMRIDSSGKLLVGTSGARANFFHSIVSPHIQQEGNGDFDRQASITSSSSTSHFGASFILAHQKSGTIGGNTACANQDVSGLLSFQANDGTHFLEHARIQAFVDGNSGANDMPGGLQFYTATDGAQSVTERMLLRANGLIQIPSVYTSTTSSAANVSVNSTGFLQRSTSSAKYKTNIETLENSYSDALLNCRPVWYQSTCETDNSDWGWWGFIAEEVAKIDPRLVQWKTTEISHDEDGRIIEAPCDPEPEGVQYDRFVPHLLNLIKRQQTAIETLEAKVAALEAN